jgi:hypothetical protein
MFTAALFTIANYGKRQDTSAWKNGSRKCDIYIQWNFIQQQKMTFCHLQVNGWNWRASY